jgi:hypothetical protein
MSRFGAGVLSRAVITLIVAAGVAAPARAADDRALCIAQLKALRQVIVFHRCWALNGRSRNHRH